MALFEACQGPPLAPVDVSQISTTTRRHESLQVPVARCVNRGLHLSLFTELFSERDLYRKCSMIQTVKYRTAPYRTPCTVEQGTGSTALAAFALRLVLAERHILLHCNTVEHFAAL